MNRIWVTCKWRNPPTNQNRMLNGSNKTCAIIFFLNCAKVSVKWACSCIRKRFQKQCKNGKLHGSTRTTARESTLRCINYSMNRNAAPRHKRNLCLSVSVILCQPMVFAINVVAVVIVKLVDDPGWPCFQAVPQFIAYFYARTLNSNGESLCSTLSRIWIESPLKTAWRWNLHAQRAGEWAELSSGEGFGGRGV